MDVTELRNAMENAQNAVLQRDATIAVLKQEAEYANDLIKSLREELEQANER